MRIEFTYTLDDLEEGLLPEKSAADPRTYRQRSNKGLLGWVLVGALIVLSLWTQTSAGGKPEAVRPQDLKSTMGPNYVAATLIFIGLVSLFISNWRRARWRAAKTAQTQKRSTQSRRIVLVAVALTLVILPALFFANGQPWVWHARSSELLLANTVPWVTDFLLFILLAVLQMRWRPRQLWFTNPAWTRPHVIEFNDTGFHVTDSVADLHFAWSYFLRAWETPNLLVLLAENDLRYIVPKRAFASTSDVERARAILQNKIAVTDFLVEPNGFPVAPLPVLPIEHTAETAKKDE